MVKKSNLKNIFKDKNINMFGTFKIKYVLLRLLVLWGILFIVSIFTNNIAISVLPVRADELNNMICDMWEVQTTISVMSIALIALIINKLDDRIYGQSIKDILMIKGINHNPIKKFFIPNYIYQISIAILLSAINIFSVMFNNLVLTVGLFGFNVFYISLLLLDSYKILFTPEIFKVITLKFLNDKFKEALETKNTSDIKILISNIKLHNLKMIKENDINNLEENIDFIFNNLNEISTDEFKKNLIITFEMLIDNEYVDEVINIIKVYLMKDNNVQYIYKKELINIFLNELTSKIIDIKDKKKVIDFVTYNIFYKTDISSIYNNKEDKLNLCSYQYNCFKNIYFDYKFNNHDILDYYIEKLIPNSLVDLEYKNATYFYIIKLTICIIGKELIDSGDKYNFFKILNNIQSELWNMKNTEALEIILIINSYIYYCIFFEEYLTRNKKETIKQFVNFKSSDDEDYYKSLKEFIYFNNEPIHNHINKENEDVSKKVQVIKNLYDYCCYNKIESFILDAQFTFTSIHKNEFKSLKMKCALQEHYVFSLIYTSYPDNFQWLDSTDENKVNLYNIKIIVDKFNNKGTFKESSLKSNFNSFIKIYAITNKIKDEEYIKNFYLKVKERYESLKNKKVNR